MEIQEFLKKQIRWSLATFGPGNRDAGILDHVRKELKEIETAPGDIEEWIDVVILALDAAWRNGYTPEEVEHMLIYKQEKNKKRQWPDWRTATPGKTIEHIR